MAWRDFIEKLTGRRAAYQRTFLGANGKPHLDAEVVLRDLHRFCKIGGAGIVVSPVTRTTDPFATHYRAGLRDAYLRIAAHIGMTEADLNILEKTHVEDETQT